MTAVALQTEIQTLSQNVRALEKANGYTKLSTFSWRNNLEKHLLDFESLYERVDQAKNTALKTDMRNLEKQLDQLTPWINRNLYFKGLSMSMSGILLGTGLLVMVCYNQ